MGRRNSPLSVVFVAILPLIAHVILTAATAVALLVGIDGFMFNIHNRRPDVKEADGSQHQFDTYILKQTDVTTLISILLVLVRTASGFWCSAVVAKSVFILLEKTGLTVNEISHIVTWRMPLELRVHHPGRQMYAYAVVLMLVLAFPPQLSNPILTGSIAWSETVNHVNSTHPLSDITTFSGGLRWTWYQRYGAERRLLTLSAAGMAAAVGGGITDNSVMKRVLPGTRPLTVGSKLDNVTLPFITITNLKWIDDLSSVPDEIVRSVDDQSTWLNVSTPANPMQEPATGNVALIPPSPWKGTPQDSSSDSFELPEASIFANRSYITLLISRQPSNQSCGDPSVSTPFGTHLPKLAWYSNAYANGFTNCYVYAAVDVVAGVTNCTECILETTGVVAGNISQLQVASDPLVREALYVLPEVATMMVMMNASLPRMYDNMEGYAIDVLTHAYQAAWGALTEYTGDDGPRLRTGVQVGIPMLLATVSKIRLYIWLALQTLVWGGAFLFAIVQYQCNRPMSNETFLAAIFLDSSQITQKDTSTGNVVTIRECHDDLGKLHLVDAGRGAYSLMATGKEVKGAGSEARRLLSNRLSGATL